MCVHVIISTDQSIRFIPHRLDGAAGEPCAQRLHGCHKVKGQRVCACPQAYQETNFDLSQNCGLSEHLVYW